MHNHLIDDMQNQSQLHPPVAMFALQPTHSGQYRGHKHQTGSFIRGWDFFRVHPRKGRGLRGHVAVQHRQPQRENRATQGFLVQLQYLHGAECWPNTQTRLHGSRSGVTGLGACFSHVLQATKI
jgi:hypothetical protein